MWATDQLFHNYSETHASTVLQVLIKELQCKGDYRNLTKGIHTEPYCGCINELSPAKPIKQNQTEYQLNSELTQLNSNHRFSSVIEHNQSQKNILGNQTQLNFPLPNSQLLSLLHQTQFTGLSSTEYDFQTQSD